MSFWWFGIIILLVFSLPAFAWTFCIARYSVWQGNVWLVVFGTVPVSIIGQTLIGILFVAFLAPAEFSGLSIARAKDIFLIIGSQYANVYAISLLVPIIYAGAALGYFIGSRGNLTLRSAAYQRGSNK